MDRCDGRTTSFSQQRLWFLDQLRPGTADHLLPLALRLRGDLDTEALAAALADVVDRHEVLRTRYAAADGEP
ncbi:condensation domain-containing protein, partial [Streptomyces asoensis]